MSENKGTLSDTAEDAMSAAPIQYTDKVKPFMISSTEGISAAISRLENKLVWVKAELAFSNLSS